LQAFVGVVLGFGFAGFVVDDADGAVLEAIDAVDFSSDLAAGDFNREILFGVQDVRRSAFGVAMKSWSWRSPWCS